MCGIAGIFGRDLETEEFSYLPLMLSQLAHRGPDAEGMVRARDGICFLGHRRLSIVDLTPEANQPMTDMSGEIIVSFNGEIYNHMMLRKELEKEFHFRTDHSDTETIVYAYRKWGVDFLNMVNGMFAVGIYDQRERRLILARDRFGEKPLYYTICKDRLYFSSEIGAFLSIKDFRKELNVGAVYDYLTFLSTYPPDTFYKNVFKVKSGHFLDVRMDGDIIEYTEKKYWDIADSLNTIQDQSYSEAMLETGRLLMESVKMRNMSDVPLAIALSGGIDSSLNLIFSKGENPDLHAINVSYDEALQDDDESGTARRLSLENGIDFMGLRLDKTGFMQGLSELTSLVTDIPIVWPDMVLMYLISKELRKFGIKVVLVGEGGDELGAYPLYYFYLQRFKKLRHMRPIFRAMSHYSLPTPFLRKVNDLYYETDFVSYRHIHAFREHEKKDFWVGPAMPSSYRTFKVISDQISVKGEEGFVRKILNLEYKLRLPELLLPRIDYSTMACGIEARAPYLDHRLVEYSMTLPFALRNMHGPKSLIKDVAGRSLPGYVRARKKSGFGIEFRSFLGNEFTSWFRHGVLDQPAPVKDFIDGKYLKMLANKNLAESNEGYRLWVVYALNQWLTNNWS